MAGESVELSGETTELRGEIPVEWAGTMDAKAAARVARGETANRMTILREILRAWHKQQVHEATLVLRVNRRQREPSDADGTDGGALT